MASRCLLLLATLYVRRLLILYVGNDVNGLNSLYSSIIGLLAVAELGVGSAIVFSMYKPIVEGDKRTIASLYFLYRKLYRIIGTIIFAAGLAVMPFLPKLISDYDSLDVNVYATFLLTLISVTLSYLYSAKTSLIEAHKNNYITAGINAVAGMLRCVLQVAAIIIWKSYVIYLVCHIIETIAVWIMTDNVIGKMYPDIVSTKEIIDPSTEKEVSQNIKAMFMHKIGEVLVGTVDSVIISTFVGVVILGKYTNYTVLCVAMTGLIQLFFTPLTSVVGHLCASREPKEKKKYFNHLYSLNYILGVICFLGFYAIADAMVTLCFGDGLELPRAILFTITVNHFIGYMRKSVLLFRDASGTFYYDRWKALAEGVINLWLSLLFVKIFPSGYEVVGVIAATIVTSLLICDTVEPYVIFKYVFKEPALEFCIRNYINIGIFIGCMKVMDLLRVDAGSIIAELLLNGIISLAVSVVTLMLICFVDKSFRNECRVLCGQLLQWTCQAADRIFTK